MCHVVWPVTLGTNPAKPVLIVLIDTVFGAGASAKRRTMMADDTALESELGSG